MAEIDYAQGTPPASERAGYSGIINMAGAMMSLALMVGVGVWGYKLLSRDVTGVPVVRAVEGPMRVQPADPGGEPADHQGLAVNDVAARGSAAAPAEPSAPSHPGQPVRLRRSSLMRAWVTLGERWHMIAALVLVSCVWIPSHVIAGPNRQFA